MVVRRKQERKDEKEKVRQALLDATLRLSASYGFASLSLREVSREAGIAPTSFYRHFVDMEQLGLVVVEERVGPFLLQCTDACCASNAGWELPEAFLHELFKALDGDSHVLRFLLAQRAGSLEALRAALGRHVDVAVEEVRDAMGRANARREVTLAVVEALVILAFEAVTKALDGSEELRRSARDYFVEQAAVLEAGSRSAP